MADDKRKILLRADRADVARWDRAAEIAGLSRTAFHVATLNAAVGSASSGCAVALASSSSSSSGTRASFKRLVP